MSSLADRTHEFLTFHAVEVFKQAQALPAAGRDIISLGIGEPDFTRAPLRWSEALERAAPRRTKRLQPACRPVRLARGDRGLLHAASAPASTPPRVIVTAGASGALSLACGALVNPGDEILMPDPSYPANSSFVLAAGGRPRLIPSTPAGRFQLARRRICATIGRRATRGAIIASPGNPRAPRSPRPNWPSSCAKSARAAATP